MINEFASLIYTCSPGDIVPSGLEYNSIANRVCAVVGSTPGQGSIAGISYLQAQYGFEASHLWRNVGINAGLFVAFALCTGLGMELLKVPAGRLNTVFYKPGSSKFVDSASTNTDQEKGTVNPQVPFTIQQSTNRPHEQWRGSKEDTQTFQWRDICLDIDTKDGTRRLLDNLSGNVRRGRMKALMGMSGAGKTVNIYLATLLQRLIF